MGAAPGGSSYPPGGRPQRSRPAAPPPSFLPGSQTGSHPMSKHRGDGPPPVAYSYVRFSDKKQAKGDSLRRQEALRDAWLARNPRVTLDTSLTLRDLGKSAYSGAHRNNPDRHALALFLRCVETGRVRPGD